MGFWKRDAQQVATEVAKQKHPELAKKNLAAAKAKVYSEEPHLRELHEQADPDPLIQGQRPPVRKGAAAYARIQKAAGKICERNPSMSQLEAERMARELHPDLVDAYHREFNAS